MNACRRTGKYISAETAGPDAFNEDDQLDDDGIPPAPPPPSPVRNRSLVSCNLPSSPPVRAKPVTLPNLPSSPVPASPVVHWNPLPSPVHWSLVVQWNPPPSPVRSSPVLRWNPPPSLTRSSQQVVRWNLPPPLTDPYERSYSRKVFVGGVPFDVNGIVVVNIRFDLFIVWFMPFPPVDHHPHTVDETNLHAHFLLYGECELEWQQRAKSPSMSSARYGCVYVVYNDNSSVVRLLHGCTKDGETREWSLPDVPFVRLAQRDGANIEMRTLKVIPWLLADECYGDPQEQYGTNQVFVGGVHGQVTASMLAHIMATEFGPVRFTRLHTDQHLYPNASGLVQFVNHNSFALAVARRALTITTNRFANKRLQIDPYLHDYAVDCFECRRTRAYGMCRACLVHLCDECFAQRCTGYNHSLVTKMGAKRRRWTY